MTTSRNVCLCIAALLLVACAGDIIEPQSSWLSRTDFEEQYATTLVDEGGLRTFELRSSDDDRLLATLEWREADQQGDVTLANVSDPFSLDAAGGLSDDELHQGLMEAWWAATNLPETDLDPSAIDPATFDASSFGLAPAAAQKSSEEEVAGASAALQSPRGNLGAVLVDGQSGMQSHHSYRSWTREVYGWSFDPDWSTRSNWVHFYSINLAGGGWVYAGTTQPNLPRSDVNAHFGITGSHGFRWTIPEHLDADGLSPEMRLITALSVDLTGDSHKYIGTRVYGAGVTYGRFERVYQY